MPTSFDCISFAIKYDRSGRSSGVAIVSFETAAEAKKALTTFDQKLCKGQLNCVRSHSGSEYGLGQPMSITLDAGPPARQARRVASAPSLINRIQKPALAERLGAAEDKRVTPAS